MIAVIDYDAGNMKSVEKALEALGESPVITRDPGILLKADKLILPGVGAFGDAMKKLEDYGLTEVIRRAALEEKKPFLGICLGMQLMFQDSEESPGVKGLGILSGHILRLQEKPGMKIPIWAGTLFASVRVPGCIRGFKTVLMCILFIPII